MNKPPRRLRLLPVVAMLALLGPAEVRAAVATLTFDEKVEVLRRLLAAMDRKAPVVAAISAIMSFFSITRLTSSGMEWISLASFSPSSRENLRPRPNFSAIISSTLT